MSTTRLDTPVLYQWEVDENSSRYDYPRGQPSEHVLQVMFSILAFINAIVSISTLVLILGILRSKKMRSSAFKLYVLFMALTDFVGSFCCLLTCALSAPLSKYYSEAMCGFQSFYLVFAFAGNAWINAVIVHEIHKLLTFSKIRRRYFPPTRQRVLMHVAIVYTYALIWGILAAFPIPGIPLHTKAYIGLACFPMEQDAASSGFFYFVFLPAILLIPFAYTIYVIYRIMTHAMLPKTGTSRRVALFLMRLVAVYFFGWLPFLILAFTGNFIKLNPWISWGGAAMSHLQGFISTVVVYQTSKDIRDQMKKVLRGNFDESGDLEETTRQSDTRFSSKYSSKYSSQSLDLLDESTIAKTKELIESGPAGTPKHDASTVDIEQGRSPMQSENETSPKQELNTADRYGAHRQSMIDLQVKILSNTLRQIVQCRTPLHSEDAESSFQCPSETTTKSMPRDHISDTIPMMMASTFDPIQQQQQQQQDVSAKLSPIVSKQLEDLIATIAELHRENNSFHNFEHASHATMSANELLQQISQEKRNNYGLLISDPLTRFAMLFSTLIHDLDHSGVSNEQLIKEENRLAIMYEGKSVAEQNAIDLGLEVLTSPSYADLVSWICCANDREEFLRFKQLVINCVMATDLFDKDLISFRNSRWDKAFGNSSKQDDESISSDLKATVVMEHIVQAASISHTMQPWKVYYSWSEKLFAETIRAFESGRVGPEKDPESTWYEDELAFFDAHVIPLAKKLNDCGAFGANSDKWLKCAMENRREWELRGKEVIAEYQKSYNEAK